MLCETFIRAVQSVKDSVVKNPNFSDDNPQVVIMVMSDEEPLKIVGEVGAVMTLGDGRVGLVVSQ